MRLQIFDEAFYYRDIGLNKIDEWSYGEYSPYYNSVNGNFSDISIWRKNLLYDAVLATILPSNSRE